MTGQSYMDQMQVPYNAGSYSQPYDMPFDSLQLETILLSADTEAPRIIINLDIIEESPTICGFR